MRVLISGAAGFVGRHYTQFLLDEGHDVVGFDINVEKPSISHPRYEHRAGLDARRYFSHAPLSDGVPDVVIHLAAIVGGRETIEGEPLSVATDLAIDATFFNWCSRIKPPHAIYFSSSAAYGVAMQREPGYRLQERDLVVDGACSIMMPDQTYGWSKVSGEYLAYHLRKAGVPIHVFRPFSGYGSDQGPEYPFGAFIDRALAHEDPFTIWGMGQQCRDWIHIDDVVRGTWEITLNAPPDVYNVCTGVPTSLEKLSRLVTAAVGYEPENFHYLIDKPSGVRYRVGDPTKFFRYHLPRITLEEGITLAIKERVEL